MFLILRGNSFSGVLVFHSLALLFQIILLRWVCDYGFWVGISAVGMKWIGGLLFLVDFLILDGLWKVWWNIEVKLVGDCDLVEMSLLLGFFFFFWVLFKEEMYFGWWVFFTKVSLLEFSFELLNIVFVFFVGFWVLEELVGCFCLCWIFIFNFGKCDWNFLFSVNFSYGFLR